MNVPPDIAAGAADMVAWRRQLHQQPELAFDEQKTAQFIKDRLKSWDIPFREGFAGTGLVATIEGAAGPGRQIGLRADMDALPISEESDAPHRSRVPGVMHACGHDGHVAILLGAARHLAANRRFAGTVHLILQPAEENEGGGEAMIRDGLFAKFPCDAVFALHNWPGLPVGKVACRPGAMMAADHRFVVALRGRSAHAAMPQLGHDAIYGAGALIQALQSAVSREIDPLSPAVVSVTTIRGGSATNAIADKVTLEGTSRSFDIATGDQIEAAVRRIVARTAEAHRLDAHITYRRRVPAVVNDAAESRHVIAAARSVLGGESVADALPSMASEDFACMLTERSGALFWLGAGEDHIPLHHPSFDFNDDLLVVGASMLSAVAVEAAAAPGPGT